ncbi:hypothetical protein P389DRAFT_74443 [Cystobasidium minutum MCA 4210]|uniref:uncharacterized protein n=1 Tax=Cystobasidium minutum MCA 4210 TaxID=1397322 RepID=UPI0034CD399B|eukprot:jgi/Rhomi1/74443/CE74442_1842
MDLSPLHFRALRASLSQLPALATAGQTVALEQAHELKRQLDTSRPAFRKLLEKLPPNPKEKEELEKGRLLPFGATGVKAVNQEFRLEALFLASQLGISERLAGSVLLAVLNDHRPRPGRPTAENAVVLYYEERRDLLLSLELLLSLVNDVDFLATADPHIANVLTSAVNELVTYEDAKDGSWTKKVLKEMDNQQKALEDIKNGNLPSGPSTSGPQARFNDDINNLRVSAHKEERRLLATILYRAAAAQLLPKSDILAVARWTASMKETMTDNTLPVCLTTLLAIMDARSQQTLENLTSEPKFISDLHSFITTKVNWKPSQASEQSPIQPLVQLAWCLFLINAFRYKPSLINETRISETVIEDGIIDAIHSGALEFCGNSLLRFKKPVDPFEELGWSAGTRDELATTQKCADVDSTFESSVLEEVDALIESFIVNASSILRKVRHREEDVLLATSLGRTTGTPTRRRALSGSRRGEAQSQATTSASEQRHDIESLFALIATLYRDSSDAALKYWLEGEDGDPDAQHRHSRLSSFLRWAADCRVHSMQQAFFEMLGSLASGPRSATLAFEFLSQNAASDISSNSLCSWTSLFEALSFYGSQRHQDGPTEIPPDEVILLKSFLRVLRIVAENSPLARASLYDNQKYKPVTTLFNLIVQPIPIDLKAALLDAVSAFAKTAQPEEGSGMVALGTEIAKRTWIILESSQILPTIPRRDARGMLIRASAPEAQGGISLELEQVETPSKVYPTTTSFIHLLVSLMGSSAGNDEAMTPSSASANMEISNASRAIPDNLGAPHRDPAQGIDAYTRFVVDEVLLRADTRDYKSTEEKWRITERCLAYLEACLSTVNFGTLLALGEVDGTGSAQTSLLRITAHPGFDVMIRLLTGTRLLEKIFQLCSTDLEIIDNENVCSVMALHCMIRALRIIIRVFAIQTAFIDVVIPTLLENTGSIPSDKLSHLRSVQSLDQHLLYHSQIVAKIAVLVNCYRSKSIGLASIRILSYLADSATFSVTDMFRDVYKTKMNRLAGVIDASDETERVLNGFVMRLSQPGEFTDTSFGVREQRIANLSTSIDESIQTAILDLLLRNTQPTSQAPNIAHLLLGIDIRQRADDIEISDATDEVPASCLHIILAYLARIRSDAIGVASESDVPNILLESPALAEKCYRVVRQLCLHDYTAAAVTQYLRQKDFFVEEAQMLPLHVPETDDDSAGIITTSDGTQIPSTAVAVISALEAQAWTLEYLALELNNLVGLGEPERAVRLLAALYGGQGALPYDDDNHFADGQDGLSQALPRMLEIFYSLDMSWTDSVPVNETPISLFGNLRFDTCLRTQSTGCQIYDFQAVLTMLQAARRILQQQGALNSQAQQNNVKAETYAILQNLVIENNRREIQHARYHSLRAWRNLLDITITRAFDLLPSSGTDSLLLDLLTSILPPIAAEDADSAVQEIFAGAAVNLMAQLRQQGLTYTESASTPSQIYSPERLIPILQALLQAIIQPGLSPVVRGNLYAVLLQYIQHSASSPSSAGRNVGGTIPNLEAHDDESSLADDTFSLTSTLATDGGRKQGRSALQKANMHAVRAYLDRLLSVVCLDASAGHEVWQTVSFTMLDAIASVTGHGQAGSKLVTSLAKQGYLQNFVTSVKESEGELLETLIPDPESLNALYAYEAKMSFLTRVASTQDGAERLLDLKLLPKLADCSFLGAKPKITEATMDFDAFLPPIVQRYHQLLVPALQVALAIAASTGSRNTVAARQIQNLLVEQQEASRNTFDEAAAAPTVTSLQEAYLIVQAMRAVLPVLSDDELTSPRGLGVLHASAMGLAGSVLAEQDFIASVQPTSDDELREADQYVTVGGRTSSAFEENLSHTVEDLQMALLEYFKATTKRAGSNTFQPLWLPNFQLEAPSKSRIRATVPTLRGAFNFILDVSDLLSERLQDSTELEFKLVNFEDLSMSELELYEDATLQEPSMDMQARRQSILTNMKRLRGKLQAKTLSSTYLIELALLLLWRHLNYYLDEQRMSSSTKPANGFENVRPGQSLRNNFDTRNLRQNASDALSLIVDKLGNLQLAPSSVSVDARPHEALIATLLRSLLDLMGNEIAA